MKIEQTFVFGFEPALRGMRNAKDSWNKADTEFDYEAGGLLTEQGFRVPECPKLGPNDLKLTCTLIEAGNAHRKFLRQIMIWVDLVVPRDIWTEIDTYKVATVRNSCSTMHKLGSRDLTPLDFENEDVHFVVLDELNAMGRAYRGKYGYNGYAGLQLLEHMKHHLPEGFLQRATYSMSYETAMNMYALRKTHRMPQWSGKGGICEWIASLPYMKEFLAAADLKAANE